MLTRGFTFTLTENGVENTYYLFGASYTKPLNLYTTHLFLFMAILSFTLLLIAGVLIFYQVWRGNSQLEQRCLRYEQQLSAIPAGVVARYSQQQRKAQKEVSERNY